MDFRLDMYMLSDVFLNWAAWVRHTSASSFSNSSALSEGLSGSGVIGLSSGRLNVTDFIGRVGRSVVDLALPLSDPSELYRVLPFIGSSLCGVGSGFRNRFKTSISLFIDWLM